MAKKQSFSDKANKKSHKVACPVCNTDKVFVRHVRALKGSSGDWKFRDLSVGVCKCNEKELYG